MNWTASAVTGWPVGTPGNGPSAAAISMCVYGMGLSESLPCFSRLKKVS